MGGGGAVKRQKMTDIADYLASGSRSGQGIAKWVRFGVRIHDHKRPVMNFVTQLRRS